MKIFGYDIGIKAQAPTTAASTSAGDVSFNEDPGSLLKAYIPNYLYKPPFGYPRPENLPLLRQLSKNPYIYSVIKTLCDEVASTPFDIVYKEETEPTPEMDDMRKQILRFLDNPNRNKESFQQILRATTKDILELDSGVIVKTFNKLGELTEIFARDGGSFLCNPDIYGYIGNRAAFVPPFSTNYIAGDYGSNQETVLNAYSLEYKEAAAYFQYGTVAAALPVPFGRREIIYVKQNPRSDSVYGLSPVQILSETITTLVYGGAYNLDFYMNNNMPEGIIEILGADQAAIEAFRQRMDKVTRTKDPNTGFMRRIGFKIPVTNQPAKFTPFQLDPKMMQIIEQQEWFTKIVWACFGVTAEHMGFTQDSNKAVAENQSKVYIRKGAKPLLNIIKYHIDKEIIPEFGEEVFEALEFKFDDYDISADMQRHTLLEQQIRMGIKTPEMVANEEGIDMTELKKSQEEADAKEMAKFDAEQGAKSGAGDKPAFGGKPKDDKKEEPKKEDTKSVKSESELEEELVNQIKKKALEMKKALEQVGVGSLENVR